MKIDVIGCGSAFSKQNNTSSILVSDSKENQWLIDCGPTVPRALWQREININSIQAIYFTHIHPDHCAGLPALINQWKSFKRTQPLDIFLSARAENALRIITTISKLAQQYIMF